MTTPPAEIPLSLTVSGLELPDETRTLIRRYVRRLARHYGRITECRVAIDLPQLRHRTDARLYRVRIHVLVPGEILPVDLQARDSLETALQNAFAAADRRLQDFVERRRESVVPRLAPARGRVTQYYPTAGYGFLETPDGREIYFDARSVLDGAFRRLDVGAVVRFTEEPGDEGPQASSVTLEEPAPAPKEA